MKKDPEPFTAGDARHQMFQHIRHLVHYWSTAVDKSGENRTEAGRMEGLVFSIFTMMDGCGDLPAVKLSLAPHTEDKEYRIKNGMPWYQDGQVINAGVELHSEWCNHERVTLAKIRDVDEFRAELNELRPNEPKC